MVYMGTGEVYKFVLYCVLLVFSVCKSIFMRGGRLSLGANLRYEKLLGSNLADGATTFLLEGVLVLCNAFDKGVLLHSSLNVVLDFLAAFRRLKAIRKRVFRHKHGS